MRVERLMTSGSSEEMSMTAKPSLARSSTRAWMAALAPTSTPRVGSSTIKSLPPRASHLAKTTFCWLPPLKELGGASIEEALTRSLPK